MPGPIGTPTRLEMLDGKYIHVASTRKRTPHTDDCSFQLDRASLQDARSLLLSACVRTCTKQIFFGGLCGTDE